MVSVAAMAFETVTGYCWPQSVEGGEHGRPAPVVGRWAARRDRGGAGRGRAHRRVRRRCRPRRQPRHAARRVTATAAAWPAALVLDVDPAWRSGYYEVVLEIDVDGKRRRSHAFFVVRPPIVRSCNDARVDPARARHQHLARLQRLRRAQPLHRRHAGLAAAADGTGLPVQAARATAAGSPRPRRPTRRWPRTSATCSSTTCRPRPARRAGPTGSCRSSSGPRASGYDDRRRHQRRPRGPPRAAGATAATRSTSPSATTSTGRPACATPSRASSPRAATPRSSRATRRSGRCASRTRRPRARPRRWSATRACSSTTRSSAPTASAELTSIWSDHLIERPENHMTGVSFARGGYHRIGKRATTRRRRLHDPPRRPLALRRHRPRLRRRARRRRRDGRLRVRRLRLHLPRRPARTRPGADGTPAELRDPRHRARRPTSPRTTATRPPPPERAVGDRVHRGPPLRHRDPTRTSSASPTATPCSAPTRRPRGGVVVTSGSTDWAHGLAGRDPQVEQITRNIFDRLGTSTAP